MNNFTAKSKGLNQVSEGYVRIERTKFPDLERRVDFGPDEIRNIKPFGLFETKPALRMKSAHSILRGSFKLVDTVLVATGKTVLYGLAVYGLYHLYQDAAFSGILEAGKDYMQQIYNLFKAFS